MVESEILRGNGRFNLFRQLAKERTLIRMHLLGRQYERLTVVTGIRNQKNNPFFLIDCPQDFKATVAGIDDCRLRFEFTGKDNLKYIFRTSGNTFSGNDICIRFPDTIERIQRRRNFRVAPPLGTKLYINAKPMVRQMNVVDVSQGGALCALVNQNMPLNQDPLFEVGKNIKHLELIFPGELETTIVQIKEAVIRRLGKNPVTGRDTCAFQFMDIEKFSKKILMEFIYRFQRDILRNRLADN